MIFIFGCLCRLLGVLCYMCDGISFCFCWISSFFFVVLCLLCVVMFGGGVGCFFFSGNCLDISRKILENTGKNPAKNPTSEKGFSFFGAAQTEVGSLLFCGFHLEEPDH